MLTTESQAEKKDAGARRGDGWIVKPFNASNWCGGAEAGEVASQS